MAAGNAILWADAVAGGTEMVARRAGGARQGLREQFAQRLDRGEA